MTVKVLLVFQSSHTQCQGHTQGQGHTQSQGHTQGYASKGCRTKGIL